MFKFVSFSGVIIYISRQRIDWFSLPISIAPSSHSCRSTPFSHSYQFWFYNSSRNIYLPSLTRFKVISQKLITVTDEFFQTVPECSLPSTVSKNTIKTIGHHVRSRGVKGYSCPFWPCTRANHGRYSSFQVIFCGSWKHNLFNKILRKKPDR